MILSGRDLLWYIQQGKLVIEPVTPEQFQQNGIDLILEKTDIKHGSMETGEFCLACTRERLEIPDDLMAFVNLRSTWARRGFMIPPTIVDAGFKGNLTLELLACGYVVPPIGERFAHLIFAKLTNPTAPYEGKYQGQSGITYPILDDTK